MAYQPTKGRSVSLQQTGGPDLSGFRSAAQSYQKIADVAYGVGSSIRSQNLNKLILDAEAEGRTAGATYDKNGNLIPLTNLNVSDAIESQVFGTSEKEALRQAYKSAAIKTYAASVGNDTKRFVNNLYNQNLANPDAIRGGLDGYINGLGVNEEIISYVRPMIEAEFVTKENQAKANLTKITNANNEKQNLEHIDNIYDKLSVLNAKGSLLSEWPNQEFSEGDKKMAEELQSDLESSFDSLRTINGYSDFQIDQIKEIGKNIVFSKQAEAHIERFYGVVDDKGNSINTYSDSLSEIERMVQFFEGDEEIDGDSLRKVAMSRLNELHTIKTNKIREQDKAKSDLYNQKNLDVILGNLTSVSDILRLDLADNHKVALIQSLSGKLSNIESKKQAAKNAIDKQRDLEFDELMLPFSDEYGVAYTQKDKEDSSMKIEAMRSRLKPSQWKEFIVAVNKDFINDFKSRASKGWSHIESSMLDSAGFAISPDVLRKQEQQIIDSGLIGDEPGQKSLLKWNKEIDAYEAKWKKNKEQQEKILKIRSRMINGDVVSQKDIQLVADQVAWKLEADDEGNSLYHKDPFVRQENIEKATKFSLAYNALHPDVINALSGLGSVGDNVDAFGTKMDLYTNIFTSYSTGSLMGGTTDYAMGDLNTIRMFKNSGINIEEYESARILGFQKFKDYQTISNDTINSERVIRNFDEQYDGIEGAIIKNFPQAMEGSGVFDFIVNSVIPNWSTPDKELLNAIDQIRNNVPSEFKFSGDIEDAIIADNRLMNVIAMSVHKQFATKKIPINDETVQFAIKNAVANDIGNIIGIAMDSEGEPYWTVNSWHKEAANSIGDSLSVVPSVSETVYADIRYRLRSIDGGSMLGKRQKELLDDEGVLSLEPNNLSGPAQTYRVVLSNPDDINEKYTVMPHYRFDYNNSILHPTMEAASKRVKNATIRGFLIKAPLIGGAINRISIENEISNIFGDLDNRSNLIGFSEPEKFNGLMEMLQNINKSVNPFYDQTLDKQYHAGDVQILMDYLSGTFGEGEYLKKLDKYYE